MIGSDGVNDISRMRSLLQNCKQEIVNQEMKGVSFSPAHSFNSTLILIFSKTSTSG